MPEWCNYPIGDALTGFGSGALLKLSGPSKIAAVIPVRPGVEAEVRPESDWISIRLRNIVDEAALPTTCLEAGLEALDCLSVMKTRSIGLFERPPMSAVWWHQDSGCVLRVALNDSLGITMTATGIVIGPDGIERPSSTPRWPQPHASFRFYRLAQLTEDLFDAFRNLYLALEFLLDEHVPKTRHERQWVGDAMGQLAGNLGIETQCAGVLGCPVTELGECFRTQVYVGVRCRVFHSSERPHDLPPLLPGVAADRLVVQDAVRKTARLYLCIAQARFGFVAQTGGLTIEGYNLIMSGVTGFDIELGETANSPLKKAVFVTKRYAASRKHRVSPSGLSGVV